MPRPPVLTGVQTAAVDTSVLSTAATMRKVSVTDPTQEHSPAQPQAAESREHEPAVATGNSEALAERQLLVATLRRLHLLYFPRLARFFTHVTATAAPEVIEQLIEDTMLDLWRARAMIAMGLSVRVAIMQLAWVRASQRVVEPEMLKSSSSPERPMSLQEILGRLQVPERAVVHLVHSAYSRREIADILSMSCESVDAYLTSAMSSLCPWPALRYTTVSSSPTPLPTVDNCQGEKQSGQVNARGAV